MRLPGQVIEVATSVSPVPTLTVLGGSSVATPVLVEEIRLAQLSGALPRMEVRLWGRDRDRLHRVAQHAQHRISHFGNTGGERSESLTLYAVPDLNEALSGADIILCQVRPGGMRGRAGDEALAMRAGIPGDEGLGPGGLSCFLRSRTTLDHLADAAASSAPRAVFLVMTSPLGMSVARVRRLFGPRCYGVCELPATTSAKVCAAVEPLLGARLNVKHAGLNHQAWLHHFQDEAGANRTDDVLAAIDDPDLVEVDPHIIRSEGAVPLPYLRLYYHTQRELERQKGNTDTRGAVLGNWVARLEEALGPGMEPDHSEVHRLLSERRMNWYRDGVIPAIGAFLAESPTVVSLNLPGAGALRGIDPEAVIEIQCNVSRQEVIPLAVPDLPDGPLELTRRLIRYERAALSLEDSPSSVDLADVLAVHPLVRNAVTASRLGEDISKIQSRHMN